MKSPRVEMAQKGDDVPDDTIRLWTTRAAGAGAVQDACLAVLTAQERVRAQRMREGVPRNEFVTGRAMLRVLLGSALRVPPREVVLRVGRHGKPEVDGIWFNVAHSDGLILIAVSARGAVGVDLERIRPGVDVQEIAGAHFTPAEQDVVRRDGDRGFYLLWARKEAALKTLGLGLGVDLDGFEVAEGVRTEVAGRTVYLQDLDPEPGWVACLGCVDAGGRTDLHSVDANQLLSQVR